MRSASSRAESVPMHGFARCVSGTEMSSTEEERWPVPHPLEAMSLPAHIAAQTAATNSASSQFSHYPLARSARVPTGGKRSLAAIAGTIRTQIKTGGKTCPSGSSLSC